MINILIETLQNLKKLKMTLSEESMVQACKMIWGLHLRCETRMNHSIDYTFETTVGKVFSYDELCEIVKNNYLKYDEGWGICVEYPIDKLISIIKNYLEDEFYFNIDSIQTIKIIISE